MANYTRYSPADWSSSNVSHYNSADNSRNNSERIRNEAVRLIRDRDEKTVLTQRDADRRIGERLHDVTFWRSELQVKLFLTKDLYPFLLLDAFFCSKLFLDLIKYIYLTIFKVLSLIIKSLSIQKVFLKNRNYLKIPV